MRPGELLKQWQQSLVDLKSFKRVEIQELLTYHLSPIAAHDGRTAENVLVQIKHSVDFQSPLRQFRFALEKLEYDGAAGYVAQ